MLKGHEYTLYLSYIHAFLSPSQCLHQVLQTCLEHHDLSYLSRTPYNQSLQYLYEPQPQPQLSNDHKDTKLENGETWFYQIHFLQR